MKFDGKVIDLSTPIDAKVSLHKDLPEYMGHVCQAYDVHVESHTGSYFETPAHLFTDKPNPDTLAAEQLIYDCLVVKVKPSGRLITAAILQEQCADIGKHNALLVVTGYTGGDHPYFSRDAGGWLANSGIKLLGADIPKYDSGFEDPEGIFADIFNADISVVAGLGNTDALPAGSCTLLVMPLLVKDVCTVPARIVAFVPQP